MKAGLNPKYNLKERFWHIMEAVTSNCWNVKNPVKS